MRHLDPKEIALLAGAPAELTPEEVALDAAIEAYGVGTRFRFEGGHLEIRPPILASLRQIGARNPEALKLAAALIVLAGLSGIEVASLAKLPLRHRFLAAWGDAAQRLAAGEETVQ